MEMFYHGASDGDVLKPNAAVALTFHEGGNFNLLFKTVGHFP
jgi:hypothetical protein